MIWPFSKFAEWAEEKVIRDAETTDERLERAR